MDSPSFHVDSQPSMPQSFIGRHHLRDIFRLLGFVSLHMASYAANIMIMFIVAVTEHKKYLGLLVPVHICIGIFCAWTAKTSIDWDRYNYPSFLIYTFIFVVMGLMQGIQIKLAFDDYREHTRARSDLEEIQAPSLMTARFHCKAMDGIVESTVFAFVSMYTLLKHRWAGMDGVGALQDWQVYALYTGAFLSFITVGLALLEVDNRTSAAVWRALENSNLCRLKHLLFRSSESALRLLTIILFCTAMRLLWYWKIAFIIVGVDYLFGALLLQFLGGHDPMKVASFLLAIPLLVVNCMQFVDAPGMSLQARWISSVIVPFRTLELIAVLVFCTVGAPNVIDPAFTKTGVPMENLPAEKLEEIELSLWYFMWVYQKPWLIVWGSSAVVYYFFLVTYALRTKPEADIHSAVADGDFEGLRRILCDSELVLDVNRYGPNGRTPLHLAAMQGQVQCMKLLIEQDANIYARTGDRLQNTALHLAVKSNSSNAVSYLCQVGEQEEGFLNAVNADGDAALHIAVRRQNVEATGELLKMPGINLALKSKGGQKAVECIPQSKFGFDRDSDENTMLELFAEAEVGNRPGALGACSPVSGEIRAVEMSQMASEKQTPLMGASTPTGASAKRGSWSSQRKDMENGNVPLVQVSQEVEDEFFSRTDSQKADARSANTAVTNCGISSFMLSAGMGALSKAFLNSIQEDEQKLNITADVESSKTKAKFEDFIEIKKLGEGAFGKVTLVKYKGNGDEELFAMKIMNKAMFKAQKMTSKAISEQYILKTSRHPYIVGLNYAFQGSTFWALVMDYCPNGDLHDDLCRRGEPGLTLYEGARLSGQSLLAVGHLHKIDVIFRDLKLENVILDVHMNAKLTDFGLAKKLDAGVDAKTMCGSYGYAAPEIMIGAKTYTKAVDLYSFGVMLYMMLSGGDAHPEKKNQRLPPMKHSSLRRRLKEARNQEPEWAKPEHGALELIDDLTSEKVTLRTTSTEAGQRRFFTQLLGGPVDILMENIVSSKVPSQPPTPKSEPL